MKSTLDVQVVDLSHVSPVDLEELWQHEVRFWRDRLLWDVSATFAALRRIMARGGLPGKALQVNAQTVGYAYYGVAGHLGVISGLVVSPEAHGAGVGETLLRESIEAIRKQGVSRIETRFVSSTPFCIAQVFEREGFRTHWREFLRLKLRQACAPMDAAVLFPVEPWQETHLGAAAAILQASYAGGIEAEIDEQYRTVSGCRAVLDDILNQGSCGNLVPDASAMAHDHGRSIGFVLVTEVAPRQGHLPHIAVLPEYQRRRVGLGLLSYSVRQLAERRFDTLSLVVSRRNTRALEIYQAMGYQSVLTFPVFTWET